MHILMKKTFLCFKDANARITIDTKMYFKFFILNNFVFQKKVMSVRQYFMLFSTTIKECGVQLFNIHYCDVTRN